MDTAKIDLKVFAGCGNGSDQAHGFEIERLIPVFHRWIQQGELDELMIDVADYSHVPEGPGVLLLCHDAHYGMDGASGRLGLLYSRRRETHPDLGAITSLEDRVRSVFCCALRACVKLENEASLEGVLAFPADSFVIRVNDRLIGREAEAVLRTALVDLLVGHLPGYHIETEAEEGTRGRIGLHVRLSASPGAAGLLRLLESAGELR